MIKVLLVVVLYLAAGSLVVSGVQHGYAAGELSDWFGKATLVCVLLAAAVFVVLRIYRSGLRERLRHDAELMRQAREKWRNRDTERGDDDV